MTSRNNRMFAVYTKFTKQHEWIKYDDVSKEGTFGITDYAQKELGDIVFVDFPFKGDKFNQGDVIGAVESVKTSAQVYVPVQSEVIENNTEIETNPALVNEDPHGKGWISKLKITNEEDITKLMDEKQYKEYLATL
eukprot:CAMPEP_0168344950 /NCGR_PEP_ID=MMETSP0213-20121227/17199_1 /TAXON_ID=151035 /ORGANISM="Euplotes harpa, Strain FSP1.4" /LENGTH=135 /DNA_ID=CAMNT_0008352945 /DNA_START=63 /DNA_END=473 /DNA_ORIENTATION=-